MRRLKSGELPHELDGVAYVARGAEWAAIVCALRCAAAEYAERGRNRLSNTRPPHEMALFRARAAEASALIDALTREGP